MRYLIVILIAFGTQVFCQSPSKEEDDQEQLYLSLNIDEGSKLELSNGKTFEIDPEDRIYSSYWITPFPIMLSKSGDPKYPVKITNLNTGTSVKGREISTREAIQPKPQMEEQPLPQQKPMKKSSPQGQSQNEKN